VEGYVEGHEEGATRANAAAQEFVDTEDVVSIIWDAVVRQ